MKKLLVFSVLAANLFASEAFRVQVTGSGQAMVMIPGLASSGETWDTTVTQYKGRFQCHVLTLAGFAGVPRVEPGEDGFFATVREQLATYIGEKKLVKPVIVGHSLGGVVAMDFASHYSELAGKVIIVDSYPFTMGLNPNMSPAQAKVVAGQIKTEMARVSQEAYAKRAASGESTDGLVTSEARKQTLRKWSAASDVRTIADAMSEMFGGDWREDLARITAPTMVLAAWKGSEDQGASRDVVNKNMHDQYSKLKGVDIRVTDNARHFIMWDDPQWMFAQFDAFLSVK